MSTQIVSFYVPTKPYDAVASINRIAAGQGSVRYAQQTAHADYNGHHLQVWWNDYRGYYICEYHWGERVVLCRSSDARQIIASALKDFKAQGLGASITVSLLERDAAIAKEFSELIEGKEPFPYAWWTWKHDEAATAYRLERELGRSYVARLLKADSLEEYRELCRPKASLR